MLKPNIKGVILSQELHLFYETETDTEKLEIYLGSTKNLLC